MFKKIILLFAVFGLLFFFSTAVFAQTNNVSSVVDINFPCPTGVTNCQNISEQTGSTGIVQYIIRLYQFGIGIVGIIAVGMIVAGGIYISTSGAVDKRSEGKDMITSAILGIVLLFGSYIILRTINPDLVNLSLSVANNPNPPNASEGKITLPEALCGFVASSTNPNLIRSEDPYVSNRSGCAYRKVVLDSEVSVSKGQYYNENKTINSGSTIWSFPYYIKGTEPKSTAKCLIYAYKNATDATIATSTVTFIDLNPQLGVCFLSDSQKLSTQGIAASGQICQEWKLLMGPPANKTPKWVGPVPVSQSFPYSENTGIPQGTLPPENFRSYYDQLVADGYSATDWTCTKAINNTAQCDSITSCAALYGTNPTPKYENPQLKKFLDNLRSDQNNGLGKLNGLPIFDMFNHSTYDVSHPTCNQSRGIPTLADPSCSHSVNSCHYGGPDGDGALAVDIGSLSGSKRTDYGAYFDIAKSFNLSVSNDLIKSISFVELRGAVWNEILRRAKKFSEFKSGRCEFEGGGTTSCSDPKASHIHINMNLCKAN